MKRLRSIAILAALAAGAVTLTGCGSTMRDWFVQSRQPGISPVRGDDASAALFRSDDRPSRP